MPFDILEGLTATLTGRVRNASATTAVNARAPIATPAGVIVLGVNAPPGAVWNAGAGRIENLGNIAGGAFVDYELAVNNLDGNEGALGNYQATAEHDGVDPVPGNDTAAEAVSSLIRLPWVTNETGTITPSVSAASIDTVWHFGDTPNVSANRQTGSSVSHNYGGAVGNKTMNMWVSNANGFTFFGDNIVAATLPTEFKSYGVGGGVVSVNLDNCLDFTAPLTEFSNFSNMAILSLNNTGYTDIDLTPLTTMSSLFRQFLARSNSTAYTTLAPLTGLARLQRFDISGCPFNLADLATPFNGKNFLLFLELSGDNVGPFANISQITETDFSWLGTLIRNRSFGFSNVNLVTAQVDEIINQLWLARANFTFAGGISVNIGMGSNNQPHTGTITGPPGPGWAGTVPIDAGAQMFDLANDQNGEGFNLMVFN